MLDKANVTEMHERSYTLDLYPFKDKHYAEFERAKCWSKNPNSDLLICGTGKQGKTGLALAMARERMLAGDKVWFQRLYQVRKENSASFLNRAKEASLLILDDLNLNMIGWREELLLNLLDLKTRVIVTMSPLPEKTVMSERVIDRLSGFVRIHLN